MRRNALVLVGIVAASGALAGAAAAATSPTVVTGGTSAVGQTSAVLHGTVNPNGSATTYYFQWGLTAAYGTNSATTSAGNGTKGVPVQATASHLIPDTTYHYRLVATSPAGMTLGADRTFKSAGHAPPAVASTTPATYLSSSGAVLTGAVNPEGQATTWYFQWGSLSSLSQQTASQTLGPATSSENVAWSLEGLLSPGTLYQYRLVAHHPGSATTYANTEVFMTYPAVRPYAQVRATTSPRHRIRLPYMFQTSGTIGGPSWMPAQYACAGTVAIRFFRGNRRVRNTLAPVGPNCTFSALSVFPRVPGGSPAPLRVIVHYLSTAYLAPSRSGTQRLTLG